MNKKNYNIILNKEVNDAYAILKKTDSKILEIKNFKNHLQEQYNKDFFENIVYEIDKIKSYWDKQKKFIMIGCGYLPLTLLTYSIFYPKSKFIGIDIDVNAVNSSNKLKNFFQIQNISFECFDGMQYVYDEFGTILIAGMVKKKITLLNRIVSSSKNGTKIIVRLFYNEDYQLLKENNLNKMKLRILYKLNKNMYINKEDYDLIVLEKH